jgi:hypothetical protein
MRDYNQYDQGYSLYSRHGWLERYRDDFVQGLRAFISLLRTGKMPEGQEAMGDKFVFETGTPEPYSPIQLSQLAALPPPEGQPAVETIAKNGMDYLKKNLYRLRIPRGLERALFISPSALRLGVAADMANVISLHNGLVALLANVDDYATRAELQTKLAAVIATKTQKQWCDLMEATDVCFAPVLDLDEAPKHAHNVARQTFVEIAGVVQPAPAPRFSATPGAIQGPPPAIGSSTETALADWGFASAEIEALKASGAA